jgi:hypothetical protein
MHISYLVDERIEIPLWVAIDIGQKHPIDRRHDHQRAVVWMILERDVDDESRHVDTTTSQALEHKRIDLRFRTGLDNEPLTLCCPDEEYHMVGAGFWLMPILEGLVELGSCLLEKMLDIDVWSHALIVSRHEKADALDRVPRCGNDPA